MTASERRHWYDLGDLGLRVACGVIGSALVSVSLWAAMAVVFAFFAGWYARVCADRAHTAATNRNESQ